MKLRSTLLCFALLAPVVTPLLASAGAPVTPPPQGGPLAPSLYPSQPNVQEGPLRYPAPSGPDAAARLAHWSEQAWRTIAIDHTPPPAGPSAYSEQRGRTRTSRVMAIFHIAIHDALNAIYKRTPGYSGALPALADSSPDAAIAQAAYYTLAALYPHQAARLQTVLVADLARLPDNRAKLNGIELGQRAAQAILALRANDGSDIPNPVVGHNFPLFTEPGLWSPDPVSRSPYAQGAYWKLVKPFAIPSARAFRPPPPPPLNSDAYARAFNEVKQLGGDGKSTPTIRTEEQTRIGIFWGYDDSAWVGTPLRMYNQIGLQIIRSRTSDALAQARALALVNVAMADATLAGWEAKFYYLFWRPVHGVREASPGTGPTGKGDGNPATQADSNWTPLGSPASNLVGPDFTPAFPSYPSGHAVTGGALFETLRKLYGETVPFTFVSDEWNGVTRDNRGWVRPRLPRSYGNFSQVEEEAGQSRIYLGVHWQFDKTAGLVVGHKVADYVFQHGLAQPAQ